MTNAIRDENNVPVSLGVSSIDSNNTLPLKIDASTGRLLVETTTVGIDNEVIVKSASDLSGALSSTVIYKIDGIIDMGSQSIIVPQGGLSIEGLGFNVSQLVSTEVGYTMFIDDGVFAGDLFISEFAIDVSGSGSKAFDLDNAGNEHAVEMHGMNFNNCTSLGQLDQYRQFLGSNIGLFDCATGAEFIGEWIGGFRIETTIVRDFGSSGIVFKAGAGFTVGTRFVTDINMDIPAGAVGFDFVDANFLVDGAFELLGARFGGLGTPSSNMAGSSTKARFRDCIGIRNTYVGAQWSLTSEATTTISVVNTPVKVAGITTYVDEQWFTNSVSNAFLYESTDNIEVEVKGTISFTGTGNRQINVIIRHWDNSASSYVDISETGPQTMNGGGGGNRAENISILGYAALDEDDRIEIWVENQTDSSNVTCKLGGLVSVTERPS